MGRLRRLEDLGLAQERQTGVWQIADDIEPKLKSLGSRGDIIKTMHCALREAKIDRPAGSFAVFDTSKPNNRIVGRVAGIGLTDEISDRHYLVVDGVDGKVHYADVGHLVPEHVPEKGMIVSIENRANGEVEQVRTRLRILSYLGLSNLTEAEGATWLDKELLSQKPEWLVEQGFGTNVKSALLKRRQWLVSEELGAFGAELEFRAVPGLLAQLQERNLSQASNTLSQELGLKPMRLVADEQISGIYLRPVTLSSGKFAIIQKSKEFTLVPWQAEMEKNRDKMVSGTVKANGISWEWDFKRKGLGIS